MPDWTTPKTWSVGDIFTAADTNTYIRDNTPIFYWKTTSKTVNNTITETDLLNGEITLAANVLGSNRRLQFWASGDLLNSGAPRIVPDWRLKLGATTIFSTGTNAAATIASSGVRCPWGVYAEIQEMNATNAQECSIFGWMVSNGANSNFTTGSGSYHNVDDGSQYFFEGRTNTTVDMTSSQALVFSVVLGAASASYEVVLKAAKVAIGT